MAGIFRRGGGYGLLGNAANMLRQHRHEQLETDDYFSDSEGDSDLEDQRPMQGAPVRCIPQAKTALPQDITFRVPDSLEDSEGGVDVVCIQGPHGPLRVPLPDGAKPGEECKIRLGPPAEYHITVPEGGKPGDSVKFPGATGEELTATVPKGKRPGDKFEVSLPVLLVQVPPGVKPGMEVMYEAPDRQNRCARVPRGCLEGHYFPVLILPPGHEVSVAEATWPLELSFRAPEDNAVLQSGQPVCVQGPHGPIMVPLPADVKPGQQCSFRIGPQPNSDPGYEVTVPDGASSGEAVQFQGAGGESLNAVVPEGKKPGEKFHVNVPTVMVRVPPGAREGSELMFQTPGEQQNRFTKVPSGFTVGNYFPVLLQKLPKEEAKKEETETEKKRDAVEEADLIGQDVVE